MGKSSNTWKVNRRRISLRTQAVLMFRFKDEQKLPGKKGTDVVALSPLGLKMYPPASNQRNSLTKFQQSNDLSVELRMLMCQMR